MPLSNKSSCSVAGLAAAIFDDTGTQILLLVVQRGLKTSSSAGLGWLRHSALWAKQLHRSWFLLYIPVVGLPRPYCKSQSIKESLLWVIVLKRALNKTATNKALPSSSSLCVISYFSTTSNLGEEGGGGTEGRRKGEERA